MEATPCQAELLDAYWAGDISWSQLLDEWPMDDAASATKLDAETINAQIDETMAALTDAKASS